MTEITGYFCGPGLYEFEGWFFEYGPCGPWPLRKDGELFKRAGAMPHLRRTVEAGGGA